MNYIEMLDLAASRGYCVSDYALNENGSTSLHPSENQKIIELSLIAKWLRDEHQIFVEVVLMQPYKYAFTVYFIETTAVLGGYKEYAGTYEVAFLQGTSTALQLI